MTLRAVLYARYSSDQQRAASIKDQFRVCRELAGREGWTLAGAYRDAAASAIRGLIERIVRTPGAKRGEMGATLQGDLGTILEWAGNGQGTTRTDTPARGMSVSVVAGAGFEPTTFGL